MENGLIEFTIPKKGTYEIIQKSRSTNNSGLDTSRFEDGPAMGVTVRFELNLEMVSDIEIKRLSVILYLRKTNCLFLSLIPFSCLMEIKN